MAALPAEVAAKNFHYRKDECPEAWAFAVGTVAGFEATMQLLADDAAATARANCSTSPISTVTPATTT